MRQHGHPRQRPQVGPATSQPTIGGKHLTDRLGGGVPGQNQSVCIVVRENMIECVCLKLHHDTQ